METMKMILFIALVVTWSSMGVSLLISTIQGMIYDFRREKRELEREKRDLEYHKKRMNEYK